MDSLWHRTLFELRERFRHFHKIDTPVLHVLTEYFQSPSRQPYIQPPIEFLAWPFRMMRSGVSEWFQPCEISKWPLGIAIPTDRLSFSDKSGKIWAVTSYETLHTVDFRCNAPDNFQKFVAIAKDAGNALTQTPLEVANLLPELARELCCRRPLVKRFIFGSIIEEPEGWMTDGSSTVCYQDKHGVVIDWVYPGPDTDSAENWVLFMHRLAWARYEMPRFEAKRICWGMSGALNVQVQYE